MWHRSEHLLSKDFFLAQMAAAAAGGSGAPTAARIQLLGMRCAYPCIACNLPRISIGDHRACGLAD